MSSELRDQRPSATLQEVVAGQGMLVVVSSPSGGGKGTLIRRALGIVPNLGYSVSFTTRPPREGEVDGHEYHFVPEERFQQMVAEGSFLEWAVVHGNLYGTSYHEIDRELQNGHDIILEIDVQGAETVRRLAPQAVTVFILPPSFEVLRDRLVRRRSEHPDELALRLRNARSEVEHYRDFKYVVINDDAERAAGLLAAIVHAERARRERQQTVAERVLESFQDTPESDEQLDSAAS